MVVETGGWRQLCVDGCRARQALFRHLPRRACQPRTGRPWQSRSRSRNTSATARLACAFRAGAMCCRRQARSALPVETVNTENTGPHPLPGDRPQPARARSRTSISARRSRPMSEYLFTDTVGEQIWSGTATVAQGGQPRRHHPPADGRSDKGHARRHLRAEAPRCRVSTPIPSPPAWQWFVISDLGVTTLSGVDGLHVFVRCAWHGGGQARRLGRASEPRQQRARHRDDRRQGLRPSLTPA